jgi:hypothetical protein
MRPAGLGRSMSVPKPWWWKGRPTNERPRYFETLRKGGSRHLVASVCRKGTCNEDYIIGFFFRLINRHLTFVCGAQDGISTFSAAELLNAVDPKFIIVEALDP